MLVLFVLAHWGHHLISSMVSPLLPFIRKDFGIDVVEAGGLVSAFTIAYGISQLPSGWLADRLGQRILIALGISGVTIWGVLAGFAPNYAVMIALMVLLGLFGGGYHPSSAPMVSSLVEPKRRGWALGIHQIGGTLSNLSAPLIAAGLATWLGWRSAFLIPGLVVVALGIVLYVLTKPPAPAAKPANRPGPQTAVQPGSPHAFTSTLIAYIIIGTCGQVFIMSVVSFVPLFNVDRLSIAAGLAAALQFVVYLGGMPAGPLAGHWSDRVGANKLLVVAGLIAGPVIFLLSLVGSVWVSLPVFLALGALMFTLMPVSEAYIINHTTESNRSTVLGVYYAASRGGSGFLTLGLGFMVKHTGFQASFAATGIVLLAVVALCVLFLWLQRRRS